MYLHDSFRTFNSFFTLQKVFINNTEQAVQPLKYQAKEKKTLGNAFYGRAI